MNFDSVEKVAAAILYEGYILYPYRPSAIKNRQRWNFGTLYPREYAEAQRPAEPFRIIAECLTVADADALANPAANIFLDVKVSFLQLLPQRPSCAGSCADEILHSLSDPSLAWNEAVERTFEFHDLSLGELLHSPRNFTLRPAPASGGSPQDHEKSLAAADFEAHLTIRAERLDDRSAKLHCELANISRPSGRALIQRAALAQSLISAHMLLGISGGEWISLLDPPDCYRESVSKCRNIGVFPVLAGDEPDKTIMLCSPIILYDYPKIAAESAGDFFDGTEMDEMLTLRVLTLTDAEKEEMRNGDPRARKILERTETMTAESMLKTHGIIRALREIREDAP